MSWYPFKNGKSINTVGSECGTIILDEEHEYGARITIEENSSLAPFSITLGIYEVMFHTDFANDLNVAKSKYNLFKQQVELILTHLSIEETKRQYDWRPKYNRMLDQLIE